MDPTGRPEVKLGVSLGEGVLEKPERVAGSLKEPGIARSEPIEAVSAAFSRAEVNRVEEAGGPVTLEGMGLL